MKRNTHYFKFTLDSYRKLSKQDILDILLTNMKNGTLDSTMPKSHYMEFLYLFDNGYSINEFITNVSKYTLIKNNIYVTKFYYDMDVLYREYSTIIDNKCKHAMIDILNSIDKNDIDIMRKIGCRIKSDDELIYWLSSDFSYACSTNSLSNFNANTCSKYKYNNIEDMVDEFIIHSIEPATRQVLSSHRDKFFNFYNSEFENCYNITSKYIEGDPIEYKQLYKIFD